jgi:5-methylcytosine-specific restriction endonuclease McrA
MVRMLAPRVRAADLAVVRLPPKAADPYYLTPEWRELRRQTLERDGGICTVPGCGRRALVADHIVSRKAGGADALHNTRSLCRLHDNRFREDPTGRRRERAGG